MCGEYIEVISQFESGISPKSAAQHRFRPLLCYLDHPHVFYHVGTPFIWEIFGAACTQEMQHNPTMLTSILGNGTNSFSFFVFFYFSFTAGEGNKHIIKSAMPQCYQYNEAASDISIPVIHFKKIHAAIQDPNVP